MKDDQAPDRNTTCFIYVCVSIYLVIQIHISVNILSTTFPCQVKTKVKNRKCLHLRQYKFDGFGIIQLIVFKDQQVI